MFQFRTLIKFGHLGSLTKTQSRNIRGVKKVFRQKLPRYKNDLSNLRNCDDISLEQPSDTSLEKLWSDRLNFYKLYMPINQTYVLLEALFNHNNNIDNLLRIIDDNLETMNSFYLATSFEALNDMIRLGPCHLETVLVSPELKNLCRKALFKLRFLEADEVLKLIKCLSTLGMSEDMLIVQSALQMARHLLNDFTHNELEALSQSLEKLKLVDNSKTSLLTAMKQAVSVRLTRISQPERKLLEFETIKQIKPTT